MGSELAMRLRTLIELLVALILTFAALFAVSKMARTTGMKVDNAYARAAIAETKTGAVFMTLNDVGGEPNRLGCAATNADRCASGIDSPYSEA
jgi:copper(I)-binding protein